MKNNLLFLIFLISLSFASSFFISSSGETPISTYNSQIKEVPPPLRFLFSGETANVHVSGLGNYYAQFGDKGEVLEAGIGSYPKPSLEISLSKNTLTRINSKQLDLDKAVHTNQLVFKSNNLACSAKLQVALGFISTGRIWNDLFAPGIDNLFSFLPF